jgi:hypothetical protein
MKREFLLLDNFKETFPSVLSNPCWFEVAMKWGNASCNLSDKPLVHQDTSNRPFRVHQLTFGHTYIIQVGRYEIGYEISKKQEEKKVHWASKRA